MPPSLSLVYFASVPVSEAVHGRVKPRSEERGRLRPSPCWPQADGCPPVPLQKNTLLKVIIMVDYKPYETFGECLH